MVTPTWDAFKRVKDNKREKPKEEKSNLPDLLERPEEEFQEELPGAVEDTIKPEGEKPQWGNFQTTTTYQGPIDETAEESTFGYITRQIVKGASRLGEQAFGRHGNIEKFGKDVLSNFPQVGGVLSYALSELVGPERWERMVRGPKGQEQILPTSEQLKSLSEKATGGYTKAKKGEERVDEYIEDIGSTLTGRRVPQAVNNFVIPVAANYAKNTIKDLGFGDAPATVTKLATWTALSLMNNVNAPVYASDLMNRGRNAIPDTVPIDVPRFQTRLQAVANSPQLLHADPRTSLARQELANIQRDLANGQTTTRSLMTTYDGVNAAKRDAGLFTLSRSDQAFAKRAIDSVRDAVREEILASGQAFPQALNDWQSGIQAWSVIHQSNGLTNWIQSQAKGPYSKILSGPAAGLFGLTSYAGLSAPKVAGPLGLGAAAGYKTIQTGIRVLNDRNLAGYYFQAINDANRQNLPAFLNNYNKLNAAL